MVRMEVTQSAAALTKEPRPQPRLRVVDVGRGHIVLARLVAPGAAKHAVVAADGGLVPGQPAAKPVPAPRLVLRRPDTSAAHGACSVPGSCGACCGAAVRRPCCKERGLSPYLIECPFVCVQRWYLYNRH